MTPVGQMEQRRFQSALESSASGLRHGTTEVVSSSLLAPTLQNCVVCTLTLWFAGQPDHCGLRNVGSYDRRHRKLVGTSSQGTMGPRREVTWRRSYTVCRPASDGWAASVEYHTVSDVVIFSALKDLDLKDLNFNL